MSGGVGDAGGREGRPYAAGVAVGAAFTAARRARLCAIAGLLAALFTSWSAIPARAGDDFHLIADGGTQFPLLAGGGLVLEMPANLELEAMAGVVPRVYGEVVNDIAQQIGDYNDATAFVIDQSFQDTFATRILLGWHPFGGGFFVQMGYAYVDLGGDVTEIEAIEGAFPNVPPVPPGVTGVVGFDEKLHMLQGALGYQLEPLENLTIRAALGVSATLSSSVRITIPPGLPDFANLYVVSGEDYLEGILADYLHVPTLTITLGYRFW